MVLACQDHSYIFNNPKAFLKIPGFIIVYVLETIRLYQIALKAVSSDFGRIQISRTFLIDSKNKNKFFTK